MGSAEILRIRKPAYNPIGLVFVGNFRKQGPIPRQCFYRKASFVLVNVMVKAAFIVPHKGVNPGL